MATANTSNQPNNVKQLYLSKKDKKISGVCGGIAEYFNADSTLIRLLWIIITVLTGVVPGVLAYFIAAVVMPNAPSESEGK